MQLSLRQQVQERRLDATSAVVHAPHVMSFVLRVGPRTILLDRPSFVIGSGPEADCRIIAPGVEPSHACLLLGDHGVRVTPLEGRTLLNDSEIRGATFVTHAMTIKLGNVAVQLMDTEAAARERLVTEQVAASDIIGVLADAIDAIDEAIEARRWDEASERIRIAGENIGEDAASRRFLDPVCQRAMQLGIEHNDPRWIDWVLAIAGRHRHVPSSPVVDALLDLSNATSWHPQQIVDYAKAVADSEPTAKIRLRRLLALG